MMSFTSSLVYGLSLTLMYILLAVSISAGSSLPVDASSCTAVSMSS